MTSLGPIVHTVSLIQRGLYTRCCWLGWHFWHTHQTRENVSQTQLHTVSRKHVVQPRNRSKTLGLKVPQALINTHLLRSTTADRFVTKVWFEVHLHLEQRVKNGKSWTECWIFVVLKDENYIKHASWLSMKLIKRSVIHSERVSME